MYVILRPFVPRLKHTKNIPYKHYLLFLCHNFFNSFWEFVGKWRNISQLIDCFISPAFSLMWGESRSWSLWRIERLMYWKFIISNVVLVITWGLFRVFSLKIDILKFYNKMEIFITKNLSIISSMKHAM